MSFEKSKVTLVICKSHSHTSDTQATKMSRCNTKGCWCHKCQLSEFQDWGLTPMTLRTRYLFVVVLSPSLEDGKENVNRHLSRRLQYL